MPNTMTLADVRAEINTRLGYSGVAVELCDADYTSVLTNAIRQINRNVPMRGRSALVVSESVKKYRIDDKHPGLRGVTSVQFVDNRLLAHSIDPFDPWYNDRFFGVGGDTIGEYVQTLQYMEMSREVTGADPDWTPGWEGREFYLYIDIHRPMNCMYIYTWGVTPDDDPDTGIQLLPEGVIDWVLDYATASAKIILARIRDKFRGVPQPDGNVLETDASTILEEGREDQTRLMEDIKKRRRPLPPVLG